MKRRTFLQLAAATPAALAMPNIVRAQDKQFEGITLNINGYGGDNTRIYDEYVAKPLQEKTGLKVQYQDGTAAAAIAQVIASGKNNPPFDIIMTDSPNIPEMLAVDAIDPVVEGDIQNFNKINQDTREFGDFGVPIITNSIILTYNSEATSPLSSYKELSRPDLKGRVGFVSPDATTGLLSMIAVAEAHGGGLDNMEPAYEWLRSARDNISATTSGTTAMTQLYEQKEIYAGPFWDGRVFSLRAKGVPMVTVVPDEGIYALYNYLSPVKGTKHKEAVLAYINQALSDEAVGALVEFFRYAPCTDISLTDELAKDIIAYGPSRAQVMPVDWKKAATMRGEILEGFNRAIA